MELRNFFGTLVKEPEYVTGVSANGYEWKKITFFLKENVSDGDVYPFVYFGNKAGDYDDMNLTTGDQLQIVYSVESREGSGDYSGKYFLSLAIETLTYAGKNTSGADGDDIPDGMMPGGALDEKYMDEDPLGDTFDNGANDFNDNDDVPF